MKKKILAVLILVTAPIWFLPFVGGWLFKEIFLMAYSDILDWLNSL